MQKLFYLVLLLSAYILASGHRGSNERFLKSQVAEIPPSGMYTFLWKRGKGLDVDLNLSPPQEEVLKSPEGNEQHGKDGQSTPASVTVKENAPRSDDVENQRRLMNNKKEAERRRKQRAAWEEAVTDSSKMTPELFQQISRHYQSQRKRQKKYYDKVETKVKSSTANSKEIATFNRHHRTIEWRSESEANEAYYQKLLKKERERKRKNREKKKQKLQKRALSPGIDLNMEPVAEQAASSLPRDESQAEVHSQPEGQTENVRRRGRPRVPADVRMQKERMRGIRWREGKRAKEQEGKSEDPSIVRPRRGRPRIPAEVRRERDLARAQRWRDQQKARFKEALQDPSKMTEEVKAEITKYKGIQKASAKKHYEKLKAKVESNAEISPYEFRNYHLLHQTAQWRSASKENQAAYERRLLRSRERRIAKRKGAVVKEGKDEQGPILRKRANGLKIDLNHTPPRDEEGEEGVLIDTASTAAADDTKGISKDQRRERYRIRKRLERLKRKQKWKEAQEDPTKLTPELKASIERFKHNKRLEYQRRAKRQKEAAKDPKNIEASKKRNRQRVQKYHLTKMQKKNSGQLLTPNEQKYFDRHYRTLEWRFSNKESHERHLMRRRESYREKQTKNAADDIGEKDRN
ncbi:uncharacterized protein FA14DRAFT_171190 [Meira miltonrushii]|uniref:Uncharacterized protein n=1 Tax=Meira miltonrushii TaxID=1280837 RepID=A0A316VQ32_9BASI|nr:uncharacterized protein FA14DRAFT_171190 [Meira miltonrushii]PWN38523.1 hypothetical protein FA14DRAFT_171190 [Meira miltonrushii]